MLSTSAPQGCVLSPLLYSLYTHDCTPAHPTNTVIKFADDTVVTGLTSGGDEADCRDEIQRLPRWCCTNNLELNTTKTKELVLDFRRKHSVMKHCWNICILCTMNSTRPWICELWTHCSWYGFIIAVLHFDFTRPWLHYWLIIWYGLIIADFDDNFITYVWCVRMAGFW